jgi:hypothetical protein
VRCRSPTTSLIVPANKKMYFVFNNTSGGFAVTVKVSGQTGILVPNGKKVILTCNGTDIVEAHTAIVGNATMGGTLGVTGATTLSSTLAVTGITTVAAGTAALPAIVSTTGTADTGLWFPAADTVAASTAGTERLRIDSSGNVGIGGSPFAYGAGYVDLWIQASTTPVLDLAVGSTRTGTFYALSTAVNFGTVAAVPLIFNTANSERMRIDSGGSVGIGTSSPGYLLDVSGTGRFTSSLSVLTGATTTAGLIVGADATVANTWTIARDNVTTGDLKFIGNTTERMRIDSSGNLIVGGTSVIYGAGISNYGGFNVTRNTSATAGKFWMCPYVDSNNTVYVINQNNDGVYILDGGFAWVANSDERLKDIIEPITDAANKVSTLRAVIGKFKTDAEGTRRSFLIAQDVQAVLPEAVTSSKLANSEDSTEYLGLAYTEVIPLLVAAIKEQQAVITSLTTRITALEST